MHIYKLLRYLLPTYRRLADKHETLRSSPVNYGPRMLITP
jgi:hypothetical protein